MNRILLGLAGAGLIALGIVLEIMWLALCFGTIVIGIVLLFFAPYVLLLPLGLCGLGVSLLFGSIAFGADGNWQSRRNERNRKREQDVIDVEVVG